MVQADPDQLNADTANEETLDESEGSAAHDIVVEVAESFIPQNIFASLADDGLLAILVASVVVGCLIKGPDSSLLRGIREVEKIVMTIITFLIKLAPIGVFFLILSNLLTLPIESIGQNLGVLIGASITHMFIQIFILIPPLFFFITKTNPYTYWMKCSPAWITAWGSASSAATLPVTLRVLTARDVNRNVRDFTAPLGALINMDGTGICE